MWWDWVSGTGSVWDRVSDPVRPAEPQVSRVDGSETRPYMIIFNNLAPLNPLFRHSTPIFSPSLPFAWPSRYGSITSI